MDRNDTHQPVDPFAIDDNPDREQVHVVAVDSPAYLYGRETAERHLAQGKAVSLAYVERKIADPGIVNVDYWHGYRIALVNAATEEAGNPPDLRGDAEKTPADRAYAEGREMADFDLNHGRQTVSLDIARKLAALDDTNGVNTPDWWRGYVARLDSGDTRDRQEAEWASYADLLDQLHRARQVTWNLRRALVDHRDTWVGIRAELGDGGIAAGIAEARIGGVEYAIQQLDSERVIDPYSLPD